MKFSSANSGPPAGHPIANALVIIVGTLVIAASIVVGFFAFVIVFAALMVLAAVVGIRLWWLRRKMGGDAEYPPGGTADPVADRQTIEGEYRVVIEEKDDGTG